MCTRGFLLVCLTSAVIVVAGQDQQADLRPTGDISPNNFSPQMIKLPSMSDLIGWGSRQESNVQTPAAFCASHGYQLIEHTVFTPDNYVLTLFRIPNGRNNTNTNGVKKEPVLIQHGLMSSAMDFMITGPERALAFILADAGYDVWLGNTRGSTYSRNHAYYNPDASQFWQYSWHEIGEFDLPAEIDHILTKTGFKKLHYIGHSQGTTAFFVMSALQPMIHKKIMTMNALAPIAYMSNLKSPFVRYLAPFADSLGFLYNLTQTGEFMPKKSTFLERAGYNLCRQQSSFNQMCVNMIYLAGGWGSNQIDPAQVADILQYSPASSSFFQLMHYGQEVMSGKFCQYDYGARKNMQRYNSPSPPEYDMTKVLSSVALHYSDNDWLAAVVDVDKLANRLPNLVGKYRVADNKFNHMDFCWGINAKTEVYANVIHVMRKYEIPQWARRPQTYSFESDDNDDDLKQTV